MLEEDRQPEGLKYQSMGLRKTTRRFMGTEQGELSSVPGWNRYCLTASSTVRFIAGLVELTMEGATGLPVRSTVR